MNIVSLLLKLSLLSLFSCSVFAVENDTVLHADINALINKIDKQADLYLQDKYQNNALESSYNKKIINAQIVSKNNDYKKIKVKSANKEAINTIKLRLKKWQQVWSDGNVEAYIKLYSPQYLASNKSRKNWIKNRKKRVKASKKIQINISNEHFIIKNKQLISSRFKLNYRSIHYSDVSTKELLWKNINGQWFIISERTL